MGNVAAIIGPHIVGRAGLLGPPGYAWVERLQRGLRRRNEVVISGPHRVGRTGLLGRVIPWQRMGLCHIQELDFSLLLYGVVLPRVVLLMVHRFLCLLLLWPDLYTVVVYSCGLLEGLLGFRLNL